MKLSRKLYSTIEYHNAAAQSDTTMYYDANGNLIRDLDRGISAYSIFNSLTTQGLNPRAAYDSAVEIIGSITKFVLDGGGTKVMKTAVSIAPKITSAAVAVAPYVLATGLVGIAGWSYYKAGEFFMNMIWSINSTFNSKGFWANFGGYDYDGGDWQ